jgi:hypothetical protein
VRAGKVSVGWTVKDLRNVGVVCANKGVMHAWA